MSGKNYDFWVASDTFCVALCSAIHPCTCTREKCYWIIVTIFNVPYQSKRDVQGAETMLTTKHVHVRIFQWWPCIIMLLTWEANYIFLQAEKLICEGHGCNVLRVFDFFFEVRKTRGGPRVRFIYLQPHTVGFIIKNTKL